MKTEHCRRWQLDQLYIGALSASQEVKLQTHMDSCEQCLTHYQSREQDAKELRQHPGFEALFAQGKQHLQKLPHTPTSQKPNWFVEQWRWWSLSGMSFATLAILVLTFAPNPNQKQQWLTTPPQTSQVFPPNTPQMTAKHTEAVFGVVHFREGQRYSRWTNNQQSLQPGDLIQFAYQIPVEMNLMIVGINNKGEVSAFFPLGGKKSVKIRAGTGTLPNDQQSLELDDYIGEERLFMVTSRKPFLFTSLQRSVLQSYFGVRGNLEKMKQIEGPWQFQTLLIHKRKKAFFQATKKRKQAIPK